MRKALLLASVLALSLAATASDQVYYHPGDTTSADRVVPGAPPEVAAESTLLTDLEHRWSLDEESGTRADSILTDPADLTDNNTVGFAAGVNGNAASFVAVNSEHLSSAGGIINTVVPTTSLSLSFWLNLADADFAVQFRQATSGSTTEGFAIYYEAPNLAFSLTDGTHENRVNYAYSGYVGDWHHILFQWDKAGSTNGTVTVYVDNVVNPAGAADLSYMPSITDTALHIGAWQTGAIGTDGLIDEVAIWSRVLTSDERTCLYGAGTPPTYPYEGVCLP